MGTLLLPHYISRVSLTYEESNMTIFVLITGFIFIVSGLVFGVLHYRKHKDASHIFAWLTAIGVLMVGYALQVIFFA